MWEAPRLGRETLGNLNDGHFFSMSFQVKDIDPRAVVNLARDTLIGQPTREISQRDIAVRETSGFTPTLSHYVYLPKTRR
jgi:hypothetical protein